MLVTLFIICLVLILVRLLFELCRVCNVKSFMWVNNGKQWAVVTGATDGIGFEFARQLAHKGYHLMLISRNEQKLEQTRQTILHELSEKQMKIEVRTLVADFSQLDIYKEIEQFLDVQNNEIFVLVNNVGAAPSIPDEFINEDPAHHQELINVNVVTITKMIEMILPSMVGKKRGLVISVSAIWARHLAPMWSAHAASKAYIGQLCECLAEECQSAGVTFCTLYTAGVSTKMAHNINPSPFVPTPEKYVRNVLSSIKYKQSFQSTGYWSHELTHLSFNAISLLATRHSVANLLGWFSRKYRSLLLERQNDAELEINVWNLLKS